MKRNEVVFLILVVICIGLFTGAITIRPAKPALFVIDTFTFYDTNTEKKYLMSYSLDGVVYQAIFDTQEGYIKYHEYLHKVGRVK